MVVMWFLRRWRPMVICLAAYDCLLIAAVVLLEWHYVADIIAGNVQPPSPSQLLTAHFAATPAPGRRGNRIGNSRMKSAFIPRPVLWLLLGVSSAASIGYYVAAIWSANQPPGFSDLYAPWWAAHESLLHHRNPYSPVIAHEIQTVIYGAPVAPSSDDPSGLGGGFAYPPFATLLLWPTVYSSFANAQKIFLLAILPLTMLSLWLWLRCLRLRLWTLHCVILTLFMFGSFPVLQAFRLQNLSLLAAAFIAITVFLVAGNRLIPAGIFLAASTFKPQFTVALIPWLVLWALADWRRRRSRALSFLCTIFLLVAISEWLVPGMDRRLCHVVNFYRHYTYGHSLLDVWFSPTFGPVASVVLLMGTLALCWPHRAQPAGSPRFLLATSLLLAANVLVIPTLAPHAPSYCCSLDSCACWPAVNALWRSTSFARTLRAAAWVLLTWPWIAAFGILLAGFWLPSHLLYWFWQVPLYTSPLLPVALSLALSFLVRAPYRLP